MNLDFWGGLRLTSPLIEVKC